MYMILLMDLFVMNAVHFMIVTILMMSLVLRPLGLKT